MDAKLNASDSAARVGIIVCSDRATDGIYEDRSGPAASAWLSSKAYDVVAKSVIPDSEHAISETLGNQLAIADFVVISGGTGIGPRDITPQTLDKICDYSVAGVGEVLRRESLKYSLNAPLSRCGAWIKNQKLVLALPGNPNAVCEQLDILESLLPSMLSALKGKCKHRNRVNSQEAVR
jgi:molybdenum cofactor synthesis domain-containing protein